MTDEINKLFQQHQNKIDEAIFILNERDIFISSLREKIDILLEENDTLKEKVNLLTVKVDELGGEVLSGADIDQGV